LITTHSILYEGEVVSIGEGEQIGGSVPRQVPLLAFPSEVREEQLGDSSSSVVFRYHQVFKITSSATGPTTESEVVDCASVKRGEEERRRKEQEKERSKRGRNAPAIPTAFPPSSGPPPSYANTPWQ
jgi:hypothetical protein